MASNQTPWPGCVVNVTPPSMARVLTDEPRAISGTPPHDVMAVRIRVAPSSCQTSGLLLSTRPGSVSCGALTTRAIGTPAS